AHSAAPLPGPARPARGRRLGRDPSFAAVRGGRGGAARGHRGPARGAPALARRRPAAGRGPAAAGAGARPRGAHAPRPPLTRSVTGCADLPVWRHGSMATPMRFGLLGPLTVEADDGTPLEVRGAKLRVLLTTLLGHANQPVTDDALFAAVWGPTPPRRADASLRVYVHHLRQVLGAARIVRSAAGYRIVVYSGELDVDRFR